MRKNFLLLFLLLGLCAPARAELSQYKGRYKLAMEIELQEALLVGLTRYYDWRKVQHDVEHGWLTLDAKTLAEFKAQGKPLADCPSPLLARVLRQSVMGLPDYPPLKREWSGKDSPLHGVKWHMDDEKVEFSFDGTTGDPDEYLARLRRFVKAIEMEGRLERPNDETLPEFSFHVHISRNDGTDLRPRVAALNHLILMRLVNAGAGRHVFDGLRATRFSDDITSRSVVRALDKDHFEIRRHLASPEEEIAEVLRWIDMSEAEAITDIRQQTEALVTDKNIDALLSYSVAAAAAVLSHVKPGLKDERFLRAVKKLIADNAVEELADLFTVLEQRASEGIPDAQSLLRETATSFQASMLKARGLSNWLNSGQPDSIEKILRISSEYCEPRAAALGPTDPRLGPAMQSLIHSGSFLSGWPTLVAHLAPINPHVREMLFAELASGRVGPKALYPLLSSLVGILGEPKGREALRAFLQVASAESLDTLRRVMSRNRNRFGPAHWAELADAEAQPVGSRRVSTTPPPAVSRRTRVSFPIPCRNRLTQMREITVPTE